MISLSEMRSYIKNYLELTDAASGLAENLIDTWVRAAHRRVQSEADWRWLYETRSVNVKRTGALSTGTTLDNVAHVVAVADTTSQQQLLRLLTWEDALQRWNSPDDHGPAYGYTAVSDTSHSGNAAVILRIWPPDSADLACLVRVKVVVDAWPTDTTRDDSTPPLPHPFHDSIQMYALSDALQREGYPDDARAMLARYHQQINNLRNDYVSTVAGNVIVGGTQATNFS